MPIPVRLAATLLATLLLSGTGGPARVPGYAPATTADTLRRDSTVAVDPARLRIGVATEGFLSDRGLPPRAGRLVVTDSGLVFRSSDGRLVRIYPRAAALPAKFADGVTQRPLPVFLFRVDAGVFGTESPAALLDLGGQPVLPAPRAGPAERTLALPEDVGGMLGVTRRITGSAYADTLYSLFGRPTRPAGLVGPGGRKAGRLGEYISARDSLALDPGRMTSEDQLRHAMAHELGHRWQSRAPSQLRALWQGVTPIRDPGRYGFGSKPEQQAEAIAFAVHYLQTTAPMRAGGAALDLLERYEVLVPGTRLVVRYLALQPVYARHPLRPALLGVSSGHRLE